MQRRSFDPVRAAGRRDLKAARSYLVQLRLAAAAGTRRPHELAAALVQLRELADGADSAPADEVAPLLGRIETTAAVAVAAGATQQQLASAQAAATSLHARLVSFAAARAEALARLRTAHAAASFPCPRGFTADGEISRDQPRLGT